MAKKIGNCLKRVPIFSSLDDKSMDLVFKKVRHKEFLKGEEIFSPYDKDQSLYIVHTGAIKLYRISEGGKEQVYRILNPGDFIGQWSLFSEDSYHENYAIALKKTLMCRISRKDFLQILQDYPQVSLKIMETLALRLEESKKQTAQIATEPVWTRIVNFLEPLIENPLEDNPLVEIPMSRKNLASYLGTTPESISRNFKEMEDRGLIKQISPTKIKILDFDELILHS